VSRAIGVSRLNHNSNIQVNVKWEKKGKWKGDRRNGNRRQVGGHWGKFERRGERGLVAKKMRLDQWWGGYEPKRCTIEENAQESNKSRGGSAAGQLISLKGSEEPSFYS